MGKNRSRLGKGWREWWEIKKSGWLYRGISPFRSKNKLGRERKSLIARFVGGLRSDIKEKVKAHPIVFLFDAIALAETIEEMNEEQSRKTPWDQNNFGLKRNPTKNISPPKTAGSKGKEIEQPSSKDKMEHNSTKKAPENPYNWPNMRKWFRCVQTVHLSTIVLRERP